MSCLDQEVDKDIPLPGRDGWSQDDHGLQRANEKGDLAPIFPDPNYIYYIYMFIEHIIYVHVHT